MRIKTKWTTGLGAAALAMAAIQLNPQEVTASDHNDAPMTEANAPADIADFYAWHTANSTIVAVITFNAGLMAGGDAAYASDVLYTVHIDNTASIAENTEYLDNDDDNLSDIQIQVRFGQNTAGEWGVQVNNLPGAEDTTFDGPVQTELTNGSAVAMAGIFDDPFFFDFEGFTATVTNLQDEVEPADLAFASLGGEPVDAFAGTNTMAIVVEFDAAMAANGNPDNFLQLWATTGVTP